MSGQKNRDELVRMFPDELGTCESFSESSSPSCGDGGNHVVTLWKCKETGRLYRTIYNDWSVNHPDTTCCRVERREKTTVVYENI